MKRGAPSKLNRQNTTELVQDYYRIIEDRLGLDWTKMGAWLVNDCVRGIYLPSRGSLRPAKEWRGREMGDDAKFALAIGCKREGDMLSIQN